MGKRPREELPASSSFQSSSEAAQPQVNEQLPTTEILKVPRYIPPNLPPEKVVSEPIRGGRYCVKKKIVIGNVSRWIPVSERDDSASHKWMVLCYNSFFDSSIMLLFS